jgi:hypothetical protein
MHVSNEQFCVQRRCETNVAKIDLQYKSVIRRCAKITKRSSHLRVSGYFVQVQVPRRVWIAITNCDLPSNNIVLRICSWWFDVCADKFISAALFMSFIKQCREVCVILVKLAIFIDILKKHPSILRCFTIDTKDASIPIRRSTSFLVV